MKKLLIVVDMQGDFITGSLGSEHAVKILPNVKAKIQEYKEAGNSVLFTLDTHYDNYLETQEGKRLPVRHCIKGTAGQLVSLELSTKGCELFEKTSFGSLELARHIARFYEGYEEIELCGVCTDICVVSNALILKAQLPEVRLVVDAAACAGVSMESHKAALLTMKMCQIDILNEDITH